MFSISAIEGKFKRSGINFEKTFLYKEHPALINLKLFELDEQCIIYYIESSNYYWYLTNKRFIIPSEKIYVNLSELTKVDSYALTENSFDKMKNQKLSLFTISEKIDFFVEANSWHLFYNIFKFITSKNVLSH